MGAQDNALSKITVKEVEDKMFTWPWLLFYLTVIVFFVAVVVILLTLGIILIRRKTEIRELADQLNTDWKKAIFIWIILSNFSLKLITWFLIRFKRIVVIGRFPKEKKQLLIVSNHPAWIDQATLIQLFLSYLEWLKNPAIFPRIGTARDSIVKLPFLKFLETFEVLMPIERKRLKEAAEVEEELIKWLNNGGNLMISGPAGRDFKKRDGETIYSLRKHKPLRKFGGLCGRLSTLDGVITVPVCIEGSERLFKPINHGKEMVFSRYSFLIRFLLLGKIKIAIVISENPLVLAGWPKEEARKEIENAVLNLADTY